MRHLGDITKINGGKIEPVDLIIGGSPCQDLSVAGLRKGLQHESLGDEETTRSGLFMEQIRIVKEMRENERRNGVPADLIRPRWMVWENVPGAFSSNSGCDFAAVIEETIKIVQEDIPSVQVPKGGWSKSGCFYDELGRWSIAWTVHNAADWCVPQRRQRISLVADFNGMCAPEILFERKGLLWHPGESGEEGKGTSTDSEGSSSAADEPG